MLQIDRVEVRYFRSIYHATVKDLHDLSVFAGPNDIGKSNLLKALNLFFNNQTDWNTPFSFGRDFNQRRLDVVRDVSIKGKQYIKVTVRFVRGNRFEKSLPAKFTVSKTWYRDSATPEITDDLQSHINAGRIKGSLTSARGSLKRYLNTIRYEYVPAIRDKVFYSYLLEQLQYRVLERRAGDTKVDGLIGELNEAIGNDVKDLSEEFLRRTGVPTAIRLPEELSELFRSFAVATTSENGSNGFMLPLSMRGDGIQARFLPSLLHFASEQSRYVYIWGFEEPENSLEHSLATKLAKDIEETYVRNAQVVLTSHSPAFISLSGASTSLYRVFADEEGTSCVCIFPSPSASDEHIDGLNEDLGLVELARHYQQEVTKLLEEAEKARTRSEQLLADSSRPVLLTEGRFDGLIITEAWKRLHPTEPMPFRVESCDTNPEQPEASAAGSSQLKSTLSAMRPDGPPTVGLFDNDFAGQDCWNKLSKLFDVAAISADLKVHSNGKVAGLMLPCPAGREAWKQARNLEVEHLFNDSALATTVEGRRLVFEPMTVREKVAEFNLDLGSRQLTEPHHQKIVRDSKKHFAEKVVPALQDADFADFAVLFDAVSDAFDALDSP